MTGMTQQDGVRFLREEHDEIRSLLRETAKAEGDARRGPPSGSYGYSPFTRRRRRSSFTR